MLVLSRDLLFVCFSVADSVVERGSNVESAADDTVDQPALVDESVPVAKLVPVIESSKSEEGICLLYSLSLVISVVFHRIVFQN